MTVSNQTYNVARGLVRATRAVGGTRRIIFTSIADNSNVIRFVPGSGVGALNRSVRLHQYRQATSCQLPNGTTRSGRCFQPS
jgi:hypothetical protein